jgi:elongation factor 2
LAGRPPHSPYSPRPPRLTVLDHWSLMNGTPIEKGSKLEALATNIRIGKGFKPAIPQLDEYYDKL